ncbi:SCN11A [Symbiodinium sp. CCMP2592]|nr:SCN11A [Symbiodinium sp. CCMP2592]
MPPHLLSVVEKVREEHSQKQKPSQKSHTRQATLVLSEAIHSPTAIRLKATPQVLRFVAETYEYVVDVLVLAYAISLGFEIDFKTSYRQEPSWGHTVELSFCIIFLCDLLVRMALAKRQFFTGRGRWWNLLDTVTVVLFVAKFLVASNSLLENLSSAFRILRMVRLFRILWALRVGLAHSSQLRQFRILLESLSESMNVLFWLLILICGNVYIFSLVLTEGIWRLCPNPQTELMCHKFGTLTNSIMTLLQIQYSGFLWGSLWDEITTLPWLIEATFLTFVAVSLLVLANTITSFICSLQTIVSKRERDLLIDKELEYNEKLVEQLYNIFHELDTNGNGAVSWTEFQLALQDERMHAFLSTLELDMSDAKKIFHILASEETNAIEESDFLLGCLRMRGGASGVDMVRIIMEQECPGQSSTAESS